MIKIYKIARTELQTLFYSPIAWLILVIFSVQTALVFTNSVEGVLKNQMLGQHYAGLTFWAFRFEDMLGYLYAYIPLLTMGLISREIGSGSIKLLYSSPVTNTQIVLGKYFAMMLYGLVLVGIVFLYQVFGIVAIPHVEIPVFLSVLLAVYLLICTYSAIGLFMSCLTSYQVVAAMGTLALLAALNYVGTIGQGIGFIRDITYWLSIASRSKSMLLGLIGSDDVIYFIIVIILFLLFSILKINAAKNNKSYLYNGLAFFSVFVIAIVFGYLSSRPLFKVYYDTTKTKLLTLTPNSQAIVKKLDGGLTITTYVNLFDRNYFRAMPEGINLDKENLNQYTRFKPETKLNYVYYYHRNDNPSSYMDASIKDDKAQMNKIATVDNLDPNMFLTPEEIDKTTNLKSENYHFVRLIQRENGEKTYLRVFNDLQVMPSEREISAALKRLVMKLPTIGFLIGQDERSIDNESDKNYNRLAKEGSYRQALINQGFAVKNVTLSQNIPQDIKVLVIADMKSGLRSIESQYLDKYIKKGGNLFILGEPGRQQFMNPVISVFGVQYMSGTLVKPTENNASNLVLAKIDTSFNIIDSSAYKEFKFYGGVVTMPSCVGLNFMPNSGFKVMPILRSDSSGWNELKSMDFNDIKPVIDPKSGEKNQSFPTMVALSRNINGKEQKIIISGDADCISNFELSTQRKNINSMNFQLINGVFYWLSDGEVPINIDRPAMTDTTLKISLSQMSFVKILFVWILPLILGITGILIWVLRKRR